MSIQKLPNHVIHQIAAGEVIERPASAAKELVENALDSGAKRIRLEFEGGGIDRLCVEDDGAGVSEAELPLVFESHATSKLRKLEDLDHILSMGFRGEAISSMASVAELEFTTQHKSEDVAHRARSYFGRWKGIEAESARVGTRVELRRLFEKLPVRHKFLKSSSAEGRRITQMFRLYALAHPDKYFHLIEADKRRELEFQPSSSFERALQVFDHLAQEENWFEFSSSHKGWEIEGACLKPRYFQKTRQKLHLFLNKRPIQDRQLEFAVARAFEGYTEYPRYAQGAIWITGDPSLYDVNVHPCKLEVRFLDADALFSAIVHGLRERLASIHRVPSEQAYETHRIEVRPTMALRMNEGLKSPGSSSQSEVELTVSKAKLEESSFSGETEKLWEAPSGYEFIGHLEKTYLLAKKDEKLFVFDQHALHERILYERWIADYKSKGKLNSQRFLFPLSVKNPDFESLLDYETELESLGIELRSQPGVGVLVKAAPAELKESIETVLRQLLQSFQNATESLFREQIATMACHSAIRAHDRVDETVARLWFEQFDSEDALGHCPHGRPTFVELSPRDFERLFHRT